MRQQTLLNHHPSILAILDDEAEIKIVDKKVGTILVEQDAEVNAVYVLLEGSLIVEHLMEDGKHLYIDTVYPYDFMGDLELLIDQPTIHQVSVKEASLLIQLTVEEYDRLMSECPAFSLATSQSLAHKLKGTTENFLNYVRLPLKVRLYQRLLEEVQENGETLRYSSDLLAEQLGVTTRSVNRLIKEMKDKGLVMSTKKNVLLFNTVGCNEMLSFIKKYN